MELKELYLSGKEMLADSGIEGCGYESSLLIYELLGKGLNEIYTYPELTVSNIDAERFYSIIERRIKGEPVSYITGRRDFYSRRFYVNRDVLIPRSETELLVESVLDIAPPEANMNIADAGTGSGCIAVTLLLERALINVIATDISIKALLVSRINAIHYGVMSRIWLSNTDLLSSVKPSSLDVVVSNPPYVSRFDYDRLDKDVKDYEPRQALLGGDDGLDMTRQLIADAAVVLKEGGSCFIETGYDQAEKVSNIFKQNGFTEVQGFRDTNGIKRVVAAKWKR